MAATRSLMMLYFPISVFFLSCLIHGNVETIDRLPYRACFGAIFTTNSNYQSNLNSLFSDLSNISVTTKFNYTSIGHTQNDTLYGMFQCRVDVSKENCRSCVAETIRDIAQRYCPFRKGAMAWFEQCTLRYSDQSFFSILSTDPKLQLLNTGYIDHDKARFNQLVMATLWAIAPRAADATTVSELFATQEANFTSELTLYTLAQCTGDLSNSNCEKCLTQSIHLIPGCCSNKRGGIVLLPSCYVRYEVYMFYALTARNSPPPRPTTTPNPTTPTPPLLSPRLPPPSTTGERKFPTVLTVSTVVPITVSILLFVACYFLRRRPNTKKYSSAMAEDCVVNEMPTVESLQFDFNTIQAATNNFSPDNKLGQGGFGAVYKGRLDNGQEIAVKRLSKRSSQGAEEFKNEVMLLAKLQHRNLVRLLGFCLEAEEKILIYEYISNKSLDYFLFDSNRQRELNWLSRYKIINNIARGILYLHEDSRLRIIHRDLKASNILLDEDMNPKISDFGLARIIQINQNQENYTDRIVGTFGYMSPEYAMHGNFSTKSDVYSFGVLTLEIICGKKNNNFYLSELAEDILTYAWKLWKDGTSIELLDSSMKNNYSKIEVLRCIHIALLCVQDDPSHRPSMASIVLMLSSYSVPLSLPKEPTAFIHNRDKSNVINSDQSVSKHLMLSTNEISVTELDPR